MRRDLAGRVEGEFLGNSLVYWSMSVSPARLPAEGGLQVRCGSLSSLAERSTGKFTLTDRWGEMRRVTPFFPLPPNEHQERLLLLTGLLTEWRVRETIKEKQSEHRPNTHLHTWTFAGNWRTQIRLCVEENNHRQLARKCSIKVRGEKIMGNQKLVQVIRRDKHEYLQQCRKECKAFLWVKLRQD